MYVSPVCLYYFFLVIVLIPLLLTLSIPSFAQTIPRPTDSTLNKNILSLKDISYPGKDSSKPLWQRPRFQTPGVQTPKLSTSNAFIRLDGGYVGYNADFRGSIDTPFAEKNIVQHSINASLNLTVAGNLPFIANAWIRRSNSSFFRDINDVQIIFNAAAYRNGMINAMKAKWLALPGNQADSAVTRAYQQKKAELEGLGSQLRNPLSLQKLIEANEILKMPKKTYDPSLPDSTNQHRADSMQRLAREYVETYEHTKKMYDSLNKMEDSLHTLYKEVLRRQQEYKNMISSGGQGYSWQQMEQAMREHTGGDTGRAGDNGLSARYKWLMGIRAFSLGKSAANYSELTAKNTNLTGVNFVYNSWYYLAFSAGLIDYRFHDLGAPGLSTPRQYMYMVRAGIGRIERTYLIFSFFQGRKQLFTAADSNGRASTAMISGVSAELRWQLNRYAWVTTEAAQSLSPDYRYNPAIKNTSFNFSDKTNKAYSAGINVFIPATATRVEALYKYTGANFQSFSSYQPNSEWKSWYVRAEQPFFNRTLKLTASLRSNDFSNPYLVQDYKGNTVFKTIQATWHRRNWPSLTIGYIPISQYSIVDSQVTEHRFQSLTANVSHYYKLGYIRLSTLAVLNKFYNNGSDTGFVFYNATNVMVDQRVYFRDFTVGMSVSESISASYALRVVGEEVNFNIGKVGSAGFGARINNLNQHETKISKFLNLNIRLSHGDYLTLNAEHGFLPSSTGKLVPNDFGNIQFIKRIK